MHKFAQLNHLQSANSMKISFSRSSRMPLFDCLIPLHENWACIFVSSLWHENLMHIYCCCCRSIFQPCTKFTIKKSFIIFWVKIIFGAQRNILSHSWGCNSDSYQFRYIIRICLFGCMFKAVMKPYIKLTKQVHIHIYTQMKTHTQTSRNM